LQAGFIKPLFQPEIEPVDFYSKDCAVALTKCGFSGVDIDIPDLVSPEHHQRSAMITTALDLLNGTNGITAGRKALTNDVKKSSQYVVIVDPSSTYLRDISARLESIASHDSDWKNSRVMSLGSSRH
jgi:hypothetical protein